MRRVGDKVRKKEEREERRNMRGGQKEEKQERRWKEKGRQEGEKEEQRGKGAKMMGRKERMGIWEGEARERERKGES